MPTTHHQEKTTKNESIRGLPFPPPPDSIPAPNEGTMSLGLNCIEGQLNFSGSNIFFILKVQF